MRRLLGGLALLAGLTWVSFGLWNAGVPETKLRERIRTAAFVAMFGAGMAAPPLAAGSLRDGTTKREKTPKEWGS